VAPASGGPRDLVESGRTGVLVAPGSGTAIAAAVAGLVKDPVVRAEYGRAGRATVDGRSWPVVVDELIGHYTAVLTSEPATSPRPAAVAPKVAFPARS
jgi:phosphatidylinositol alpha 1,6-mannosyltransferase